MGQLESRVVADPAASGDQEQGPRGSAVRIAPALIKQINGASTADQLRMAYEKGANDMKAHIEENPRLVGEHKLDQKNMELLAREERESKYIQQMSRRVKSDTRQLRQDLPCLTERKATIDCYDRQRRRPDSAVLDCSPFVEAYMHCTSGSSSSSGGQARIM